MLSLRDIVKTYTSGDSEVHALQGVSIDFRESEFVSILGPSGCGKTTMLNIIGGLDRYTSGDLIINGRSTKEYRDADWDTYRNHSIGFVFQSYNLIMHQTVLANVELALTLSGVSREERRARAIDALEQVGLGDQIHKKPNQMSGGQMQRVAIARALVNDPDILLADEPTGALDTGTSVQIMEILKKVSEKKLIIMVTHNPDLAAEYSNRIIRVLDGKVIDDSNPYTAPAPEEPTESPAPEKKQKTPKKAADGKGKRSMSFLTALSLSFTNLLTKKTRTLLVSVAGSIGIIGIALILALSNGVNLFIAAIQEETLTSYPVSLTAQTSDYAAMLSAMVKTDGEDTANREPGKIYVDDSISNMVGAMVTMEKNNLGAFNEYLQKNYDKIKPDITAIQYAYNMKLQIFNANSPFGDKGLMQVSPSKILSDFSNQNAGLSGIVDNISIFSEIMPGRDGELINQSVKEQYELVGDKSRWPERADELVLVVDRNNTVTNLTLYMLGLCDPDEMTAMMASMMVGEKYEANTKDLSFTLDDFYNLELFLAYNTQFFEKTGANYTLNGKELPIWADKRDDASFDAGALRKDGMELKIVGIICPAEGATSTSIQGSLGYTSALTEAVLAKVNGSEVVQQQIDNPTHDVFTGLPFAIEDAATLTVAQKIAKLNGYFEKMTPAEKVAAYLGIRTEVTDKEMAGYLAKIKEVMSTKEQQKQFLIDLYGFNSGNGSLAAGSTANEAVAAILWAADMLSDDYLKGLGVKDVNNRDEVLAAYEKLVPTFTEMFELDGIPLLPDDNDESTKENSALYKTYEGLISTMYDTDEKLSRAFDSMTEATFRMVYAMVESNNVNTEIAEITAPHFAAFLAGTLKNMPTEQEQHKYMLDHLQKVNGIQSPVIGFQPGVGVIYDPLYLSLRAYVEGMQADGTLATKYYTTRIGADEAFKNEAIAALFDSYRAEMTEGDEEKQAEYAALYENHMQKSDASYEDNLVALGASAGHDALTAIHIYPVDFEAKERLNQMIKDYNASVSEEDQIDYTDIVAIMMSSVTIIVDAISYVLIAFVSISLVVSSIMIGIITYISVLERTKEIGILRAIGASKRDISRVFNAETLIIGFAAGAIGILTTVLLCIPINIILRAVTDMNNIKAVLPVAAAFILVAISMALTLIAGVIPSRIASKKDPVEALRSE